MHRTADGVVLRVATRCPLANDIVILLREREKEDMGARGAKWDYIILGTAVPVPVDTELKRRRRLGRRAAPVGFVGLASYWVPVEQAHTSCLGGREEGGVLDHYCMVAGLRRHTQAKYVMKESCIACAFYGAASDTSRDR